MRWKGVVGKEENLKYNIRNRSAAKMDPLFLPATNEKKLFSFLVSFLKIGARLSLLPTRTPLPEVLLAITW